MRTTFLYEPEDIDWLRSVHLKAAGLSVDEAQRFNSALLYGNEDSPERLDLYVVASPVHDDVPDLTLKMDAEGNLR